MADQMEVLPDAEHPPEEGTEGEDEEEKALGPKLKYPHWVWFIIGYEFCERFAFYGIRVILANYLKNMLRFSEDDSTAIFHTFNMLCYLFPILGAVLADLWLGKYKIIFYISVVYCFGNVLLVLVNVKELHFPQVALAMTALSLIAFGTGGVKPCVTAFGGDQFVLPEQDDDLQKFFSIFYFSINAGSLISMFLTPELRDRVECFGYDTCYPLAFGIPNILMFCALAFIIIGLPWYKLIPPEGNILVKVSQCISHALNRKIKLRKTEHKDHWLQYADDKFDRQLILDVKLVLDVLVMFLPLPIYWALFDQQSSRWVFQANHMNGYISEYVTIKPDHMQVSNPLFILMLIPIFDHGIYPLLNKMHMLRTTLQKVTTGGFAAALAFFISMVVELELQKTYAVLPGSGEAQLRIFNGLDCEVKFEVKGYPEFPFVLPPLGKKNFTVTVHDIKFLDFTFSSDKCQKLGKANGTETIGVMEKKANSYFMTATQGALTLAGTDFTEDHVDKSVEGFPLVRIIYNLDVDQNSTVLLKLQNKEYEIGVMNGIHASEYEELKKFYGKASCEVFLPLKSGSGHQNTSLGKKFTVEFGGVYILVISNTPLTGTEARWFTITTPNTMHMLWLLPQYFVMTVSEILFSIPTMEFSFTQAPISMKSLIQAAFLETTAIGNILVSFIAEGNIFPVQAYEFAFYGCLMVLVNIVFIFMAMRYTYLEDRTEPLSIEELDRSETRSLSTASLVAESRAEGKL